MFVYGGSGQTDGPHVLTNKEFYKKLANQYTESLSSYTAEGQCYRVDLRLRPDGTLGEICISEEGAREYYSVRARDWEKQMLIKARISAGDAEPGAALLELVEPLIYRSTVDFRAVEALSETRQRISEKLASKKRSPAGLNVKLTPGGIRDFETTARGLGVLRLAAAALARAGFGALRRAVVENACDAGFARSDGELVLALSMPRRTEWSLGLLQVNRLWVGALHELGQAAPAARRTSAHRRVS